jgi:hypothetical protein
MKFVKALTVCAVVSVVVFGGSSTTYAGYAVAGCAETGAMGFVGNDTQTLTVLSIRV